MNRGNKGFTLIEIMIVLVIIATISLAGVLTISTNKRRNDLDSTAGRIVTLLRQAQSDSVAEKQGVAWGIHFANTTTTPAFYALFYTSYSSSTTAGYYPLPATISYMTSTLAQGATLDITYSSLTGGASASTTIGLYTNGATAVSTTISISASGAVGY